LPITREDIANLALRNGHQRHDVHDELDRHQVVKTAAQHLRLVAGFPLEGDETAFDRVSAEALFDDTNSVVGDEADARQHDDDQHHADPYKQKNKIG